MPVQFVCHRCRQLLSVSTRKVGTLVACPRCTIDTLVPTPEEAAASVAQLMQSRPAGSVGAMAEMMVFDDVHSLLAQAPGSTAGATAPAGGPPAPWLMPKTGGASKASQPAERITSPGDMLLVSRQVVYIQGVLFCLVAALAFAMGYWIGYGKAPLDAKIAQESEGKDKVLLAGNITAERNGQSEPDAGAVIMALPEGKAPPKKFSARGLRPHDPDDPVADEAMKKLHDLGGDCVRTDEQGNYNLVVPQAGRYHLLIISRKSVRSKNEPIDPSDINQMSQYFEVVPDLIGQSDYVWSLGLLEGAPKPVNRTFGAKPK
jgi:hypothetical protein